MLALNGGTIAGNVDSGADADLVTIAGSVIGGSVMAGAGADQVALTNGSVAGTVDTGTGNDAFTQSGGSAGAVATGDGADTLALNGGTITGNVDSGADADLVTLNNASVLGTIATGSGDDQLNWNPGNGTIGVGIAMGSGSDIANITAPAAGLSNLALDGGDDVSPDDGWTDILNLRSWSGPLSGAKVTNWEIINQNNGSLSFSDSILVTSSASGQGLFLNGGSILYASNSLQLTGNVTIDATSALIAGSSGANNAVISGYLSNRSGGVIDMTGANAATGDRLNVGDYIGGGDIYFDAALNASMASDTLVIGGLVLAGPTGIHVNNIGTGPGSYTGSGAGHGILLVDVSAGGTQAGDFFLAGGPVSHGAFIYDLNLESDSNWYLQTNFIGSVPTYEAYAQAILGLNTMPTLQQRVGNRYWAYQSVAGRAGHLTEQPAIWTRIEGARAKQTIDATSGALDMASSLVKAQAGWDALGGEDNDGNVLIGGLTAHWGHLDAKLDDSQAISAEGYGLGATLTWYHRRGGYVDLQASATRYLSGLNSAGASAADQASTGYSASVEIGKRLNLSEDMTLTPQAQLIYSTVRFDNFTDSAGSNVTVNRARSLTTRFGLSLDEETFKADDRGRAKRQHAYVIANLFYEAFPDTSLDLSGTTLTAKGRNWTGELGLGGSYNWADDRYSLYGEASLSADLQRVADNFTVKGTLGFRAKW